MVRAPQTSGEMADAADKLAREQHIFHYGFSQALRCPQLARDVPADESDAR